MKIEEFNEWTPDGHLRHSKFVGLSEDKVEREVVRESHPEYISNLDSRKDKADG